MTEVKYVDQFNLALTQASLMDELKEAQKKVHDFNKFLEDRYLEQAKEKLHEEGKDFGTVNIFDGNSKVKVELRKKTSWDQESLLNYLNTLPNDLAKHYSKVTITVPEARFINATPDIKKELRKHRTVDLQGVKITFGGNE